MGLESLILEGRNSRREGGERNHDLALAEMQNELVDAKRFQKTQLVIAQ